MDKIVISGAGGFVGTNLTKYLQNDFEIAAYNRAGETKFDDRTFAFVHLAGKAHDLKNVSVPEDYYVANLELTVKLYDAFLASKASVFIFMSSVKAAADRVDGVLDENTVPAPETPYGKSKQKAEEYILSKPLPAGKSFYILRPCMIHGPGNKGNLNLLYKFVSKGIPYPLASFHNQRSFLGIENLCFVIKEILQRTDIPSGIYNVADDKPLSTNEVVTLLAKSLNRSPRLMHIPKGLISTVAKLGDIAHLPLNSSRLQKLTENYCVSNSKIKAALKKPLPLSSEESIIITAQAFKNA